MKSWGCGPQPSLYSASLTRYLAPYIPPSCQTYSQPGFQLKLILDTLASGYYSSIERHHLSSSIRPCTRLQEPGDQRPRPRVPTRRWTKSSQEPILLLLQMDHASRPFIHHPAGRHRLYSPEGCRYLWTWSTGRPERHCRQSPAYHDKLRWAYREPKLSLTCCSFRD